MESLRELYRVGFGPSSSHTMGPAAAARQFRARTPQAARYRVELYGSLAATGRGHHTDLVITRELQAPVDYQWRSREQLPLHPNGMEFFALAADGAVLQQWRVYSVGGGALKEEGQADPPKVYPLTTAAELLAWAEAQGEPLWRYVETCEGAEIWAHLGDVWAAMRRCLDRGLQTEGTLPGGLQLRRKARGYYLRAQALGGTQRSLIVSAYALAVSEENAAAQEVVTAPTCGACGVMPAVLRFMAEARRAPDVEILRALATAGLFGNFVKKNASISGAEVGCQGEVGTACAMAAAAAAYLSGGTAAQIEYAAEMGLEHHLGLTCDPVLGLVQVPCIERNAFGASRALDCADFALLSDGRHRIPFDEVVRAMKETGRDLSAKYRETGLGGLASVHKAD